MSRIHRLAGHARAGDTCELLFGHRQAGSQHDLPCRIDELCRRTRGNFGPARHIIRRRTLAAYYLPMLDARTASTTIATMRGPCMGSLKYKLGLLTSGFGASHPLRACPTCMAEDVAHHGVGYWHRNHQWPGVWYCSSHRCALLAAHVKRDAISRFQWLLPTAIAPDAWRGTAKDARLDDPTVIEHGLGMAMMAQSLAALPYKTPLIANRLANTYKAALVEQGLTRSGGRLRIKPFGGELSRFVAPLRHLPDLSALPATADEAVSQFTRLIRRPSSKAHPLRHLVMAMWLFGSWKAFYKAYTANEPTTETLSNTGRAALRTKADEVQQSETVRARANALVAYVASTGASARAAAQRFSVDTQTAIQWLAAGEITIRRRPKKLSPDLERRIIVALEAGQSNREIADQEGVSIATVGRILRCDTDRIERCLQTRRQRAIRTHRHIWRRLLAKGRGLSPRAARLAEPATYAWLYRNDRAWLLSENDRTRLPSAGNNRRLDWDARDRDFAHRIDEYALESIRQSTTRVTFRALLQHVDGLGAKRHSLHRLPLTVKSIERALAHQGHKPQSKLIDD
ncbi:TniQ family protein [Endozoicomonas sp. G2_2]|nr:TniQ family protein [Endozoicomonas sp. G2_2]